jgi:prepilin-type N-terminal cleavage/methylation domain-containing protein/prepilin-type processing-associated H-X9-DG protein
MKPFISCTQHSSQPDGSDAGFTLPELLVVIAVVTLLAATQVLALSRAKPKSQTARCASNMRIWGMATAMYLADNGDQLPYYAFNYADPTKPYWHGLLAPYVAKVARPGIAFAPQSGLYPEIATDEVSKCPSGSYGAPPSSTRTWAAGTWNCWIGANFGTYGSSLNGPFYYGYSGTTLNPPLSVARIKKPADALIFMDTDAHYLYSPVFRPFTFDCDGDGVADSDPTYAPYNHGRPTVHENGANVTLMDGHVERVSFKKLWQLDGTGKVLHSFWYMED